MGSCGTRVTTDPRTFGPDAWRMLHYFAENYPSQPGAQTQEACVNFLNAIPHILPCTLCGFDFAEVRKKRKSSLQVPPWLNLEVFVLITLVTRNHHNAADCFAKPQAYFFVQYNNTTHSLS